MADERSPEDFAKVLKELRDQSDYIPPPKRGPKSKKKFRRKRMAGSDAIQKRILLQVSDYAGPNAAPKPPLEAITDEDLRLYTPPEQLLRLARFLIQSHGDHALTAESMGWDEDTYAKFLSEDPLRLAWLSQYCHRQVEHMLGLADLAMFRKAAEGDPTAYKALMDRYGKMIARSMSVQMKGTLPAAGASRAELEKFSPKQLEALVSEKMRRLGLHQKPEKETK